MQPALNDLFKLFQQYGNPISVDSQEVPYRSVSDKIKIADYMQRV